MADAFTTATVNAAATVAAVSASSNNNNNINNHINNPNNNNNTNNSRQLNDVNAAMFQLLRVPVLPKNAKILLLDIEGVTTAISFIRDVLIPYVTNNLPTYLNNNPEEWQTLSESLQQDVKDLPVSHPAKTYIVDEFQRNVTIDIDKIIIMYVHGLMKFDVKSQGLTMLQGQMWKSGYEKGELKGHIYSDFPHMLKWMNDYNVKICIYSSGSIEAQKLLFSHSTHGDLCPIFHRHFDISTSGSKLKPVSYLNITRDLNAHPSQICFVSDCEAELVAARMAGIGHTVMSIRAGNARLTSRGREFPIIFSLMQLCGCE